MCLGFHCRGCMTTVLCDCWWVQCNVWLQEMQQCRRQNLRAEEEIQKRHLLERRRFPQLLKQERKTRMMIFKESLRISQVSSPEQDREKIKVVCTELLILSDWIYVHHVLIDQPIITRITKRTERDEMKETWEDIDSCIRKHLTVKTLSVQMTMHSIMNYALISFHVNFKNYVYRYSFSTFNCIKLSCTMLRQVLYTVWMQAGKITVVN